MTTILAYTSPARGHLYPIVPVLTELLDRGHRVAVRTLASQVPAMRAEGFDAAPIDPTLEGVQHDDYVGRTPMAGLKRSVATFSQRAFLDAADLQRAAEEVGPDLLLVDINAWGALAAAEAAALPWATWCPYPLPIPSRHAPPFGPGLPPARGVAGRFRDRLLGPLVLGSLERTMAPAVSEVRARMGLAPVTDARALYTAAPPCACTSRRSPSSIPGRTGRRRSG
jgi:UDP:flavonoid glycosyltransferase YjiC (YdhE family)